MPSTARRLLAAASALLACMGTHGAIYEFDLNPSDSTTYIYSEGPMFVKGSSPMGKEDSTISLDLTVSTADGAKAADGVTVNIVYFDSDTASQVVFLPNGRHVACGAKNGAGLVERGGVARPFVRLSFV